MAAKKRITHKKAAAAAKRAAKKTARRRAPATATYKCPASIGVPVGDCAKVSLPTNVPKLVAELEAYLSCLCAWQTMLVNAFNACCADNSGGPGKVPPPPPPPF